MYKTFSEVKKSITSGVSLLNIVENYLNEIEKNKDLNAFLEVFTESVRENAKNGLAVVQVVRGSCGGCFNKIPPQRQSDIRQGKKIIVCEHCGRILVDDRFVKAEA